MRVLLSIAALFLLAVTAHAVCNLPPPGPADEMPPNSRRPTPTPPPDGSPTPTPDPEDPGGTPTPPPEPGDPGRNPPPDPDGGGRPQGTQPQPGAVGGRGGTPTLPGRRRPAGPSFAGSWNLWWELNREYIFGLRKPEEMTSDVGDSGSVTDTLATYRRRVREALSKVAFDPSEKTTLRATALRALGRAGIPDDAVHMLEALLRSTRMQVQEGAAIGLASLRDVKEPTIQKGIRDGFLRAIETDGPLKGRAQLVAILSAGLRAREDEAIAKALYDRLGPDTVVKGKGEEIAALLYACGISRCEVLTKTLTEVAESGRLGRKRVHDTVRAHCVLGLAMCGGSSAAPTLAKLLVAKKVQVQTRRSTALALGLLLREGKLDGVSDEFLQQALIHCFEEEHDDLVKGYCAIAMGAARKPFLMNHLVRLLEKTGSQTVKPYAALALGLSARTLGGAQAKQIGRILLERLRVTRDINLAGALSISLGLAGATEAHPLLLERAANTKLSGGLRGPACEALGLFKIDTPEVVKVLGMARKDGNSEVVKDAVLAMGFLGKKGTGPLLAESLREARSPSLQIHMVVALSHLGGAEAINPLLEVLNDRQCDQAIRGSAASALGILLDPRSRDPLFEIDAYANPYGLTTGSRELVRVY